MKEHSTSESIIEEARNHTPQQFHSDPIEEYLNSPIAFDDVNPQKEEEQRHPQSANSANMMITNYNPNPILPVEADETAGVITTNHVDLDTKIDGSLLLSKCQVGHKR